MARTHGTEGAGRRVHEIESTTNINRLVTGYYARCCQCERDGTYTTYVREGTGKGGFRGLATAVADVKRTRRRHIKFYLTLRAKLEEFPNCYNFVWNCW